MAFNPLEARDSHGRWMRGQALRKLLTALHNDGKLSSGEYRAAVKATEHHEARHKNHHPHDEPVGNLEHAAKKTREAAVGFNKTDQKKAQKLRKEARSLERAHAAATGKTPTKGKAQPEAKPTPTAGKPERKKRVKGPKVTLSPEQRQKIVDDHVANELRKAVVHWQGKAGGYSNDKWPAPYFPRAVTNFQKIYGRPVDRTSPKELTQMVDDWGASFSINAVHGNTSEMRQDLEGVKVKALAKADAVVARESKRRSRQAAKERRQAEEAKARQSPTYKLPETMPSTSKDLHAELARALKEGASPEQIAPLDPSKRYVGKTVVEGHAQQVIFDLALRRSKGPDPEVKVLSDAELRKQLEGEGKVPSRDDIAKEVGYTIRWGGFNTEPGQWANDPMVQEKHKTTKWSGEKHEYVLTLPPDTSDKDLSLVLGAFQHYYGHGNPAEVWQAQHPKGTVLEFARELNSPIANSYSLDHSKRLRRQVIDKTYQRKVSNAIKKARKGGEAKAWEFTLPKWEDVKLEEQKLSDVSALTSRHKRAFVPTFHVDSRVEDGVVYHKDGNVTASRVTLPADDAVRTAMEDAGARVVRNSKNIDPGYRGRGEIHAGKMYLLETEPGKPVSEAQARNALIHESEAQQSGLSKPGVLEMHSNISEVVHFKFAQLMHKNAGKASKDEVNKLLDEAVTATEDLTGKDRGDGNPWFSWYDKKDVRRSAEDTAKGIRQRIENEYGKTTGGKRIEYVPHDLPHEDSKDASLERKRFKAAQREALKWYTDPSPQSKATKEKVVVATNMHQLNMAVAGGSMNTPGSLIQQAISQIYDSTVSSGGQDAPTNQRGRITVEGHTPEEALAKLQELGIVGKAETHVPFEAVFRGKRREGQVLPLHRNYLTGADGLPDTKWLVTHGFTAGAEMERLKQVIGSGGIMSIAERYKHGIKVRSASPAGDIRSGIDHVVFGSGDSGSTCGSHSAIKIAYKPEALLRRDVIMAPRDFGGMGSRYDHYKRYLNDLQEKAGEPTTSLYQPASPKVRQMHFNKKGLRPGSSEYNIGGSVPVEDWAVIGVRSAQMKSEVEALLQDLLAKGEISSQPTVVLSHDFRAAVGGEV